MRVLVVALILGGLVMAFGPGQQAVSSARWWLLNSQPPDIELGQPGGTVRGQVRIPVRVQSQGRAALRHAWVDATPLDPAPELVVDTTRLPDGAHRLVVEAQDESRQRNSARREVSFVTDNTPPEITARLDPPEPVEGHTVVLRARASESGALVGSLGGRELVLFGEGPERWAVLGIPPFPAYRQVELRLRAVDGVGNERVLEERFPLKMTPYTVEDLDIGPEMEFLTLAEPRGVEQARLNTVYAGVSGPPLWRGRFEMPVEGPITTEFGTRRSYNGRPPGDGHAGTDYAVPQGTPVHAPANGRVALTGLLEVRGNTLVLDHGAGVFTTYAHLHELRVREGDQVSQGDVIATVGSTGFSTGPHLHWELWVAGANVDPEEWTRREIP